MRLHNSTVSENAAQREGGGFWINRTILRLHASTVSDNTATSGGGLMNGTGVSRPWFCQSLIAGNAAAESRRADCAAPPGRLTSRGHNLVGTGTGCPSDTRLGDLTVDPATVFTEVLGPLKDNGGPTWTHALLPGSPAIDAGDPARCAGRDQRGVERPQGDGCDIGAYEFISEERTFWRLACVEDGVMS